MHIPLTSSINADSKEDYEPVLSESISNLRQLPQSSIIHKQGMVSVSRLVKNSQTEDPKSPNLNLRHMSVNYHPGKPTQNNFNTNNHISPKNTPADKKI